MKKKVYVIYEEREESQLCEMKGAWHNRKTAKEQLEKYINTNPLFSDESYIDYEKGFAKSDPTYCEEKYSDYTIKELVIL